ncbi:glycosyltransferase family 29 protein [Mesobacterium pallidum]|uniref:glycosyltransferase family 29 protein n=1 Tax=Mesobacterium pallidum TaxID=2872037 RepID=UPI001EE28A7A|nr:glycosyltransferase family 29 protein [Mesobacterium pallidum]
MTPRPRIHVARALIGAPSVKRQAQQVTAAGDVQSAQDGCVAVARTHVPMATQQALRFLTVSTNWMAAQGRFAEAERPWRALDPDRRRAAREGLVVQWWKYGLFGPDQIGALPGYLAAGLGPTAALRAYRMLEIAGAFDDRARDRLIRALTRSRAFHWKAARAFKVGGAGILLNRQEDTPEIARILSDKRNRREIARAPDIAAQAIRHGWADTPAIRRADAVAQHLRAASDSLWQRLSDPHLSVAVVGNSPKERGLGKGPEIDAHNVVIRFNLASVPAPSRADYGARTSIIVCNTDTVRLVRKAEASLEAAIVTGLDMMRQNPSVAQMHGLIADGYQLARVPEADETRLIEALGAPSSSGLQIILSLLSARGGASGLSFYGFGLTDQIGENRSSANFARKTSPSFRHNWTGEKLLFDSLTEAEMTNDRPLPAAPRQEQPQAAPMKALRFKLAGDHAKYHCGSAAVADYIKRKIRGHGVLVDGDEYEVLVVNGEGSMHHDTPAFVNKMKLMESALDSGRKVLLINTLWQQNSNAYDHVLKRLDQIVVREKLSQIDLRENHGIEAQVIPDLSYSAPVKTVPMPFAPKGKVLLTDFYSQDLGAFVILNGGPLRKLPYVDMRKLSWNQMVTLLKRNEMLITGRHHAVYAACKARVPFVSTRGNSHKIEGIFASAGVEIPMLDSLRDIEPAMAWARANRQAYDDLFDWLGEQPDWRIELGP